MIEFDPISIAAATGRAWRLVMQRLPSGGSGLAATVSWAAFYWPGEQNADIAMEHEPTETGFESDSARVTELLARGAIEERRLLKQERKAEKRLATARAALAADRRKLALAQERVERRQSAVVAAEEALQACQTLRAAGPTPVD